MTDSRDSESPFGVQDFLSWDHAWNHHHYAWPQVLRAIELMKQAGVAWVRMDFLWSDLEPQPGRFDFARYDRLVDLLVQADFKILATLVESPAPLDKSSGRSAEPGVYLRFALAAVTHFKDRVRDWELWNEPDTDPFWQPQDGMQTYTALLKQLYPALKAEDPTCRLHVGGLGQRLPASLKNIYGQGGKSVFDVVDIHPFVHPLMPDALGGLRYLYETVYRLMKQEGHEAKPLWFTALGAPGMQNPREAPDWWLGKNPTEIHQAEWVSRLYADAASWPGVTKIFWSFFRDTPGHFGSGADYSGLVRRDFSPKPAFEAYRKQVEQFRLPRVMF